MMKNDDDDDDVSFICRNLGTTIAVIIVIIIIAKMSLWNLSKNRIFFFFISALGEVTPIVTAIFLECLIVFWFVLLGLAQGRHNNELLFHKVAANASKLKIHTYTEKYT